MKHRVQILAVASLLLCSYGNAQMGGKESASPAAFTIAHVHFERNATDGDFEVVFEARGGTEGLTKFTVVSPDGRTVVDFSSPDATTLGMRQFRCESPEPENMESVKSAFPEGVYTFSGATTSGIKLHGKATLNHKLSGTASFLRPKAGAKGVSVKNLEISWTPVQNVAAYIIYLEQDESDINITATLRGSVNTFTVPNGFLLPDTEYTLGIGTVTTEGNTTIVETTFATSE